MKLIGFNFTKISATKSAKKEDNIRVEANIDISDISPVKTNFFDTKEELLGINFEYSIDYNPDYAKISLSGILIVSMPLSDVKSVLDQWKDKKIDDDLRMEIFNLILKKSTLRSLELEEELNLPYHIQMPSLKKGSVKEPNKGK